MSIVVWISLLASRLTHDHHPVYINVHLLCVCMNPSHAIFAVLLLGWEHVSRSKTVFCKKERR